MVMSLNTSFKMTTSFTSNTLSNLLQVMIRVRHVHSVKSYLYNFPVAKFSFYITLQIVDCGRKISFGGEKAFCSGMFCSFGAKFPI